ncbi:MAG: NAD(P)-dependent alcohol dehydrogenase [Nocardioides sp.]
MKAVVQHRYGGVEQLRIADLEAPEAAAGEVLVRVRAAGVERGTVHLMTGLPLVGRVVLGLRRPRCPVPGRELAGVVEAVGEGVTRFAVGDEVMGVPAPVLKSGSGHGALAELTRAVADGLVTKPAALSFAEAAAVPVSASTALQAVRDHGRVRAGQRVLVSGASGGVGTYAVQLATSYGAEVTAVCGPAKHDLVRALGAVEVLDYTRGEPTGVFDVVLDLAGNRPVRQLRSLLTPTGTLVIVGGEGGGRWFGGLGRNLGLKLRAPFTQQRLVAMLASENRADLEALAELAERGAYRPAVERTFTLEESAKAIAHLQEGHARGKVVVLP